MPARIIIITAILTDICHARAAELSKPPLAQACAAFDVHLLTQLEDHGRAATTTGHVLTIAMNDLIDARAACFRGDYAVALDRYSRIDLHGPKIPFRGLAEAR